MSYRIKIFESVSNKNLEDKVNKFLDSLFVITVKDIKYTYNHPSNDYPDPWYTAMVIYSQELEKEE